MYWLIDKIYRSLVWATFAPVTIKGAEHMPPDEPAIIIGNHQSSLDIPVIALLLQGQPHLWLALAYYARKPGLGIFIRKMGVPVDRERKSGAARALMSMLRAIQGSDRHVIVFPEGSRYTDGEIHAFFRGFAVLACKTNRPVIPVFMPYNKDILPPGHFLVHWHPLEVVIGEPFRCGEDEDVEEFTKRVREWFIAQNNKG